MRSVLVLIPGLPRMVGGAAIVGQMAGIQLTGNFGYFNLLTTMLCIATLDVRSSLMTALRHPAVLIAPERALFTMVAVFIVMAAPVYLIFNSWFTYGFLEWPAFERLPRGPLRALLAVLRFVEPLRIVNSYGVFHASASPPVRWVTVVEGSDDGRSWKKYRYRFTQTDARSRPRFVAPHHPRLDHHTFYDAVGVDGTGYLHPVSLSNPYLFSPSPVLARAMQRVLDPGSPGARLFAESPFPDAAPRLARVGLYRFSRATREEHERSGSYWNVVPVGLHLPPTSLDPDVWKRWLPPPELFHFEAAGWRRHARSCRGITDAEMSAFWDDFLPFVKQTAAAIAAHDPYGWRRPCPCCRRRFGRRYTRQEVRTLQLTLGRLTMVLMARLEGVFSRPGGKLHARCGRISETGASRARPVYSTGRYRPGSVVAGARRLAARRFALALPCGTGGTMDYSEWRP